MNEPFPDWNHSSQQPLRQHDLQGIMPMLSQDGLPTAMESEPTTLLDLDDLNHVVHSQSPFTGPSYPPLTNPFSPTALPLEYQQYQAHRRSCDQEAWNPLWALTSPSTSTPQSMLPGLGSYAMCQQSTPSDNGNLYQSQGFPKSDSAYETQICSTSSTSSANMMDTPCYSKDSGSVWSSDSNQVPSQRMADSEVIACDNPNCSWRGKCPSDKKKHEARHRKEFRCDEPNCTRKEGFGTVNDLARHKKCVHKQNPTRCPKMVYKCFGPDCPRRDKEWPRLDNFKQHISRIHGSADVEKLVKKSNEWYHKCSKARSEGNDSGIFDIHQDSGDVKELLDSCSTATPGQSSTSPEFLQSPESLAVDTQRDCADWMSALGSSPSVQDIQSLSLAQLPGLSTLGLQLSDAPKGDAETIVAEAAESVLDAMSRIMSNNRRMSHQTDEGIDITDPHSDLRSQLLHKIFSAAWERVSSSNGSSQVKSEGDKGGWHRCKYCSKRTRRQCEMKKHQKRHERPYGCTFCDKTFGSKADWKRHERSQHEDQQNWGSDFQDGHFLQVRAPVNNAIKTDQFECQSSLAESLYFWCGFCQRQLPLESSDVGTAWNERFNHIDEEHFKSGQRNDEWKLKDAVEKQDPGAEIHTIHAGEDGDYENNRGFSYAGSQILDNSQTASSALKRKSMAVDTPSALSSPGESKKRHLAIDSLSTPEGATGVITRGKHNLGLEFGPETVSCCQCRNGLCDVAECLFRPHTPCEGCHGMEFSGSGCTWSNPS